jgi:GGDEF domain-containing protein
VVLLSEVARPEDVAFTAEKILAEVSKAHHLDHQDLQVTVSMGIGVYPADGTDAETLLKHADMALLYAKTHGRSNHQFFQPDMNMRAVARVF